MEEIPNRGTRSRNATVTTQQPAQCGFDQSAAFACLSYIAAASTLLAPIPSTVYRTCICRALLPGRATGPGRPVELGIMRRCPRPGRASMGASEFPGQQGRRGLRKKALGHRRPPRRFSKGHLEPWVMLCSRPTLLYNTEGCYLECYGHYVTPVECYMSVI